MRRVRHLVGKLDELLHRLNLQGITRHVVCDLCESWIIGARYRDVRRERHHPAPAGYWYGWDTSVRPATLHLCPDLTTDENDPGCHCRLCAPSYWTADRSEMLTKRTSVGQ